MISVILILLGIIAIICSNTYVKYKNHLLILGSLLVIIGMYYNTLMNIMAPVPTPAKTVAPTVIPTMAPTPIRTIIPTPTPAKTVAPTVMPTMTPTPIRTILPTPTPAMLPNEIPFGTSLTTNNKLFTKDGSGYIILNPSGSIDFVKGTIVSSKWIPVYKATPISNPVLILRLQGDGNVIITINNNYASGIQCRISAIDRDEIKNNKYKIILTNNGELRFADSNNKIIDKYGDLFPILNDTGTNGCKVAL